MMHRISGLALRAGGLLLLGYAAAAPAGSWTFDDPNYNTGHFVEGPAWREQQVKSFPPYPEMDKLLEIRFDHPGARFRYFIDPKSITLNEKDRVTRYTLVLRSKSGANNVMFEAMRCDTGAYKTLAYGTSKGKFRPLSRPKWQDIDGRRTNWFRREMMKSFICDMDKGLNPRSPEEVVNAIRYFRTGGAGPR